MKVTYTKILARKVLLALLALAIIFSVIALFVRNTITKKLENISKLANNVGRDQYEPEQTLLLLHQVEDDFQEFLLNVNSKKNVDYKVKLMQAFNQIDTLLKERTDTTHLTAAQINKVKFWYQKKLKLFDRLYDVKHSFDSLLTAYSAFTIQENKKLPPLRTSIHNSEKVINNHSDTVQKVAHIEKKGLFRRLKEAISNKNNNSAKSLEEINNTNRVHEAEITMETIAAHDRKIYDNRLKQLQRHNNQLLKMQRELIILNTHISNELENIINDVKEINYSLASEFKEMSFKSYRETTALLNRLYLAALFLVLLFALLLIIFIVQLNKSELWLRKENERSVAMAQQKMDLLLHMSHEIRSPLTAIKGFLNIFSKTNMEQKQAEMMDSIRLSSDMLLRTLNDTLDAAKMENSEIKINTEPFSPDFMLKMVIESMEFSAIKKNLILTYDFKGDKEAMVMGDSYRLKQIMVNLVSNAIKYTARGSVTVTAELSEGNLKVDVSDTGAGISQEQQANLFSKYYQTNSSKGHTGTGLGLFICKQLITLQGGKITVNSKPETGSVFSFFIPYKKADNSVFVKQVSNDPLYLLNGICVLAVDENELNLMILKMMLGKWNIKFLQAPAGKEALDIIAKNTVTVVLIDMQMPKTDGNELLAAIKKLNKPLNQLPVIAIAGTTEPGNADKYLKMGFSGMIRKPFTRIELVDQLIKVLDHDKAVNGAEGVLVLK